MANNQPTSAIPVIPSDDINIPLPGIITNGNNISAAPTTLEDPGQDFLNSTTNPNGYNISGGDVVVNAAGEICEIESVDSATILTLRAPGLAGGNYDIYKGNISGDTPYTLFIGTGGAGSTLTVKTAGGNDVTLNNIPDSSFSPLQVVRVLATGTTCSDILALN